MKDTKGNIINAYNLATNKQKQLEYNNEIVHKTWEYQKKYDFEASSLPQHEFWNNEADAFKHAFMSGDLMINFGELFSNIAGIKHEIDTYKNPQNEWNMDSWNNNQGRKIANEIKKEYGLNFLKLSDKQKDDILAEKIIQRMKNGQLITTPNDKRNYDGSLENLVHNVNNIFEKIVDNNAIKTRNNIISNKIPFTHKPTPNLFDFENSFSTKNKKRIYTREEIDKMHPREFIKEQDAIMHQVHKIGVPSNAQLNKYIEENRGVVFVNSYRKNDGTIVKSHYRSLSSN